MNIILTKTPKMVLFALFLLISSLFFVPQISFADGPPRTFVYCPGTTIQVESLDQCNTRGNDTPTTRPPVTVTNDRPSSRPVVTQTQPVVTQTQTVRTTRVNQTNTCNGLFNCNTRINYGSSGYGYNYGYTYYQPAPPTYVYRDPVYETRPRPSCTLDAGQTRIQQGQSTTLHWSSAHTDGGTLNEGIGNVGVSGSRSVSPIRDTTYVLRVDGTFGGSSTCTITVRVDQEQPGAPTCDIRTSRTVIGEGESVSLIWNSTGGDREVFINQGIGSVNQSGSRSVSPRNDITYTMRVSGEGGNTSCSTTVRVDDQRNIDRDFDDAPTCELRVSPSRIEDGEEADLIWETDGEVDSAQINQGIGFVDEDGGREEVSPNRDTTYRMTVRGPGGSDTCTATLRVDEEEQQNVAVTYDFVETPSPQPLTSVTLTELPYTGAGDTATMTLMIGTIVLLFGAFGYLLWNKALPFAFAQASKVDGVGFEESTFETPREITRREIRIGGKTEEELRG